MDNKLICIPGLLDAPRQTALGKPRPGRFVCHDVQWVGAESDAIATFTVTAGELLEAAESHLLYTDQDVQRGIQPGLLQQPPRELALADGYPDPKLYIFDRNKADDIAEKLLRGDKLFLSPLVWNLRPGNFEAYWNEESECLHIYSGKMYLPDSHHRQQAIIRATAACLDEPKAFKKFSPAKQFKVELYFLSKEDEGNYFFDKNQLTKPTSKSKSFDLTTNDDLSMLAKRVIDKSPNLQGNVNRVTDRLTQKNPQVITLSTLREMMRNIAPGDILDTTEIEGLAELAAEFFSVLANVRPEIGLLDPSKRRAVRSSSLVDAAVMMHGYAALAKDYLGRVSKVGFELATEEMRSKASRLSASPHYKYGDWSGDLFDRGNPLWIQLGVLKQAREGRRPSVTNSGASRQQCKRALRQIVMSNPRLESLDSLGAL